VEEGGWGASCSSLYAVSTSFHPTSLLKFLDRVGLVFTTLQDLRNRERNERNEDGKG
jgi:hypothetical protein